MKSQMTSYFSLDKRDWKEREMMIEKRRQAGVSFPAPRKQDSGLIIRFDIITRNDIELVSQGLRHLCTLFELIDEGSVQMEGITDDGTSTLSPLSNCNFSATIGFGKSFFEKLNILNKCPKKLREMTDHSELGDKNPYALPQTDMILQIASNNYLVNKMVLQNDCFLHYSRKYRAQRRSELVNSECRMLDVLTVLRGWAKVIDVHNGFRRPDGKNLMGFYDGISNPDRLTNNIVWVSNSIEDKESADGTYMVFQKIEHDLNEWNKLKIQLQEKWVGRSKATGLLLGTLSSDDEAEFVSELDSNDDNTRWRARLRLTRLIEQQRDATINFFDSHDAKYLNIDKNCPPSSHVRRVNPRALKQTQRHLIFRRGFL